MLSSRAKFNNNCKCGKKFSMQRIVGGSVTSVNEYPWQAAITTASGAQYCGGSLITNKHILTAAHCFEVSEINHCSSLCFNEIIYMEEKLTRIGLRHIYEIELNVFPLIECNNIYYSSHCHQNLSHSLMVCSGTDILC